MEIDLYQVLKDNGMILLFLVIGTGYLLGNIRLFNLPIGPTIGVLLVGLFCGHYDLTIDQAVGSFGFALFIFSIGLEAGPSFFSAFRRDGKKYIALSLIVAASGLVLTFGFARLFGFATGFDAGLMAGALTSTPTLAAAQDAVRSGLASIEDGLSADQVIENIGVGYALTYLVGTIVMILIIRYVPRLMNIKLEAIARTYAMEMGLLQQRGKRSTTADTLPVIRAYQITQESDGKTIAQRRAELNHEGTALKIRRNGELIDTDAKTELKEGDIISIIGSLSMHQSIQQDLGAVEVLDADLLNYHVISKEIVVLNNHVLGKTINDLDIIAAFGCFAAGLHRSGIDLPVTNEVILNKGDSLVAIGEESRLNELASLLGHVEHEIHETDLVTFSLGIVLGTLIGLVTLSIGGIAIGLGTAGGLLIIGLAVGYASTYYPTFGRVPEAARYLLMNLGLMMLMASIGLNAGGGIVEALMDVGLIIIICALLVTTVPLALGYLVGRKLLKMNPALLLGSLTGAMTSTPALSVVTEASKSSVPAIGYAGTYTIANVVLTFAGTFLMSI
jgi:putative transport protein